MRLIAALTVVVSLPMAAAEQSLQKRIEDAVTSEVQRQKVPGAAVAVLRGDTVLTARGYGFANLEHRVPVTRETMFQSGSVGKQFTAAGIALLAAEGRLSFDDPVTKYLTEAPASWSNITVRHLLTHTSGVPDYTAETLDLRRDYTEDELADFAFRLKREFPPGTRWNYSNTGYVLLGIIIRKVTGEFYGDFLRERLFRPAGMQTARVISEEDIIPHRAAGYRRDGEQIKNQEWVAPKLNTTADGSLYVSLNDMIAWARAIRGRSVLPEGAWKELFAPVRLASGNAYPYGLGWSLAPVNDRARIHHGGAWQGFKAYIARYVDEDLTVIALMNLANGDPEKLADVVAGIVDPNLRERELVPIADNQPEVTARVAKLIESARAGCLDPAEMAYVRAGFFPNRAAAYQKLLQDVLSGDLVLMQRRTLGDDTIHVYELRNGEKTLRVRVAFAPDGKIADFAVRRHP